MYGPATVGYPARSFWGEVDPMRVALFFDGKNFYSGWKDQTGGRELDFRRLAGWLVEAAGGSLLWGAYWYTGVERGEAATGDPQRGLAGFLDMLELQPGYFVKRFPRKSQSFSCEECGAPNRFTHEKEVDTTMVADMLRLAAVHAFDVAVLVSGDADHAPAVEGIRMLGKQVYVATWAQMGLSSRLRKAAFDHIDLMAGLDLFAREAAPVALTPDPAPPPPTTDALDLFLRELERAEGKFAGRYVGVNFFVTRWKSDILEPSPEVRRRLLDKLVADGRVELYDAEDGCKALRLLRPD